jgi:hypothetical protein
MTNARAHNPENYQVAQKVSLWARKKGSVSAADWLTLGSVLNVSFNPEDERLEHFSNYRGARRKDREIVTQRKLSIDFTLEEFNLHNLKLAFGRGFEAAAVATKDAKFDTTVKNPGGGLTIALGQTNIKNVVVRSVSLKAPVTYVEGAGNDYMVNLATGVITILAGGDLELPGTVPQVHIFFEKEVDVEKFELFPDQTIEAELQFQILGKGSAAQIYGPFENAVLKNNGSISFGDGAGWDSIPMRAEILVDAEAEIGDGAIVDSGEIA